jgi:transcriptional antiterminator RfaH
MYVENSGDKLSWYVVYTKPKQEERAVFNLRAWNVEVFAPRLKERRRNEFTGKVSWHVKPMFPRYIFARFRTNELLHKVNFTRGVQTVVSFNGGPTAVCDEIIELIQLQQGESGFIIPGEELRTGDRVTIKEGPLKDFTGVFEESTGDSDRVSILLTTVSYQTRVVVEREMVRKAS